MTWMEYSFIREEEKEKYAHLSWHQLQSAPRYSKQLKMENTFSTLYIKVYLSQSGWDQTMYNSWWNHA